MSARGSTSPGLIEKAAARLSRGSGGSLVEKAVARLDPVESPVQGGAPKEDAKRDTPPRERQPAAEVAARPQPAAQPVRRKPAGPQGSVAPEPKAKPARRPRPEAAAGAQPERPARRPQAASTTPSRKGGKNVVQIDLVKLQMAGMVTPNADRKRIVEEFRIVKRPLLNAAFASGDSKIRNGNLIMVTSARPGDGKTFSSVNLAMSMASERDINVVLVDADVVNYHRDKSVMSMLGVSERRGLLDVLNDPDTDLSDVLLRTNVPNLSLLPAGSVAINPTELLASNRMGEVVEELAERYPDRVIIFDTPPVLATSEPSVLAMHVGQVVFVVEAEKTSRKAVEASLSLIRSCQHISLVLNKADYEAGTEKFGAYYYG